MEAMKQDIIERLLPSANERELRLIWHFCHSLLLPKLSQDAEQDTNQNSSRE